VQGERAMAQDNKSLGRFVLEGIPTAPRGIPQVEVSFDVDANGILSVKAKDKTSGKEQSIRIEASSGLSKDDIAKMQKDAEIHEEEDKKKKDVVEARNISDQMIYTAEKSLKDNADKITEDIKKSVEEKIEELKKVKDGTDMEVIKKASVELSTEMSKIGEHMAKQTAEAQAQTASEGEVPKDETVRDAEFKEEPKEENK
jgi:molecular chaperone DnaK